MRKKSRSMKAIALVSGLILLMLLTAIPASQALAQDTSVIVGPEFDICGDAGGREPAVTYDSINNRFLVTWTYEYPYGENHVYGQLVNANGTLYGSQLHIMEYATLAGVAFDPINARFLVVYHWGYWGVYGLFINAEGSPCSDAFFICDGVRGWDVAFDSSNQRFLVVMTAGPSTPYDVWAQLVNSNGTLYGGAIQLTWAQGYGAIQPEVECDEHNGRFLVTWKFYDDLHLHGRLINDDGTLYGGEIDISSFGAVESYSPLTFDPVNGRFLLLWDSRYGRLINSDGTLYGTLIDCPAFLPPYAINQQVTFDTANQKFIIVGGGQYQEDGAYGLLMNSDGSLQEPYFVGVLSTGPSDIAFGSAATGALVVGSGNYAGSTYQHILGSFVKIASNQPPVANDDVATTTENTLVTINVLANDSDPDGDTLSVTGATDPDHGTATVKGDNTIDYTPDADYNGSDSFDYTISDGHGSIDTATGSITVNAANDAPVAVDICGDAGGIYPTVTYDSINNRFLVTWANDWTDNGYHIYGQLVNADGTPYGSQITIWPYGAPATGIAFDPINERFLIIWGMNYNTYGRLVNADGSPYSNEFLICNGSAYDVAFDSSSQRFLVAMLNTPSGLPLSGAINVYAQFVNSDGSLDGGPIQLTCYTNTGAYGFGAYSPDVACDENNGRFLVTWGFADDGQIYGHLIDTDGTFYGEEISIGSFGYGAGYVASLTFDPVNSRFLLVWGPGRLINSDGSLYGTEISFTGCYPPYILPGPITFDTANQKFIITGYGETGSWPTGTFIYGVLLNSDGSSPEPYFEISHAVRTLPPPGMGVAFGSAETGALVVWAGGYPDSTYLHILGSFVKIASNQPPNDNPDAMDDSPAAIDEDSGANSFNVLSNDTCAPDVGETLTITAVTQGAHGAVTITNAGADLTYTPAADYFGADTFTYTISDGNGGSDTATVSVTVNPIAPTMHVASITILLSRKGPNWEAQALVQIVDEAGKPVKRANVIGDWSGAVSSTGATGTTNGKGEARINSGKVKAQSGQSFTFMVTDVSHTDYIYDPAQNVEAGDSGNVP